MTLGWNTTAILAFIALILLDFVTANGTVSCWTPPSNSKFPEYKLVDHVYSYIKEFCTPTISATVNSHSSLAKNWTIGPRTLELSAAIDGSDHCQHDTFSIKPGDRICKKALSRITDQCDIRHTQSKSGGSLLVDDCQIWSLGKKKNKISAF